MTKIEYPKFNRSDQNCIEKIWNLKDFIEGHTK